MFNQLRNIDSAFKHIRLFSIILVLACASICCYTIYQCLTTVARVQERIYILSNGKALEAWSADRKDNIPVEARDHVKMFHSYFFTLDPDDRVIEANIRKALYMSDGTAKKQYDDLRESRYYSNVISGNVSQQIIIDSVAISTDQYPYEFVCYAKLKLVRSTSIVTRSLITQGMLRNVSRSDNNPHGFLIEQWRTIENRDLKIENR